MALFGCGAWQIARWFITKKQHFQNLARSHPVEHQATADKRHRTNIPADVNAVVRWWF